MIIDRLEFADRYVALHPQFGAAFRFLRQMDPNALPDGRLEINGSDLFAIVERTTGKGPGGTQVEHHRRYLDIQYVVSGEETIGWIPIADCEQPEGDFDTSHDVGFYADQPTSYFKIPAGCFAIFLPEDGHAPLNGQADVHKVVLKVSQSLEQILEDLRAELAASDHLDANHDARLRDSIADIQVAMDNQQSPPDSFAERMREVARELEVTHPRLTHAVGRVADALAQIGI